MPGDLEDLGHKLDAIQQSKATEARDALKTQNNADNMSKGIRAGTELVGAIAAGVFLGLLIDGWLGTKPLFLIIMLILGVATGFFNVWKTSQNIGVSVGFSELHKRKKDATNPHRKIKD